MAQVSEVFTEKKNGIGARSAAKELNISLASFYNYAAGTDLPRMEVLRDAQRKWGTQWKLVDPGELLKPQDLRTPEQLVFSFLQSLQEKDVKVAKIGPEGESVLSVTFKIRFPA